MSAIYDAVWLGQENRALKRQTKELRAELRILLKCCDEALSGEWDRGDEGFISMKESIQKILKRR